MSAKPASPVLTFKLIGNELVETEVSGASLDVVSRELPDGTYTTLRTFGGDRLLRLDDHLARLEESAALLGQELELDRWRIRQALADVLQRTQFEESRLRVTVPLTSPVRPDVYLTVERFEKVDPMLYATGVRTSTMLIARSAPRAKATEFIVPSRTLKAGLPPDIYEVLIVTADGRILEGFTSNFFALVGPDLLTAGEGVLEGITRAIVLELAEDAISVVLRPPELSEIAHFDEAFITSSSRGVLPVIAIDDHVIGNGKPGRRTGELRQRYEEYVEHGAAPPVNGGVSP